ncbi:sensor histidine kinase [Cellulomonas hominis]|nr:sensor histidine kinase [Cellulomonas hominis]NKY09863.1 sensor histidine kinase [Cellulomonas hominis]
MPPAPAAPGWVGDAVAAALIVLVALVPLPAHEYQPGTWWEVLLVISPAAVLPLRRRWPLPVLAVTLALFGAASFAGVLSPGASLASAIAMFGVANRSTRRTTTITGAVAVVVVFLLCLPAVLGSVLDPRVFQFVLAVAFAAAAGDGARSRRAYVAAITERAERAERTREAEARRRVTEERLRIARDLHDAVAHQIAVISLNAGVASSALDAHPERTRQALGTVRQAARTVLAEIGDLLAMLRADEAPGSVDAPQPGLDQLDQLLAPFASAGLEVRLRTEGDLDRVSGATGIVAYRVLQEALTNAHKHGAGHRAHVLVEVGPDALHLSVVNPVPGASGSGPGDEADPLGSGVGLIGLRERVASVRGTATAGTAPGGWRVAATIPLSKEARA